jgi:peptidoglycan/LPS O-acetylase OafA/YrhL
MLVVKEHFKSDMKLTKNTSIALDFIRVFCSQLVLLGHGFIVVGIFPELQPPHYPYMQNIAVVSFFILSGFLITYSVFEKLKSDSQYGFKEYFIDRFARIYSGYAPCLLFIFFFDLMYMRLTTLYDYHKAFNLKTFFGNLLMLQDYPIKLGITSFGSGRPFWTLAIEWWIYMSFGWGIFLFSWGRKSIKNFSIYILILLFFSIVPLHNFWGRGHGLSMVWIFGSLAYFAILYLNRFKTSQGKILLTLGLFFFLALLRVLTTIKEYELVFAFLLTVSILLVVLLFENVKFSFSQRIERIVRFFASFSFTLYMIHYSLLDFTTYYFKDAMSGVQIFLFNLVSANVLAWLISRFSEIHYRKLGSLLKSYIVGPELTIK